jgi:hypothetical protein
LVAAIVRTVVLIRQRSLHPSGRAGGQRGLVLINNDACAVCYSSTNCPYESCSLKRVHHSKQTGNGVDRSKELMVAHTLSNVSVRTAVKGPPFPVEVWHLCRAIALAALGWAGYQRTINSREVRTYVRVGSADSRALIRSRGTSRHGSCPRPRHRHLVIGGTAAASASPSLGHPTVTQHLYLVRQQRPRPRESDESCHLARQLAGTRLPTSEDEFVRVKVHGKDGLSCEDFQSNRGNR